MTKSPLAVGSEPVIKKPLHTLLLLRALRHRVREVVPVDGDGAAGAEDAVGLGVEGAEVLEPVGGLARGHEVDAAVAQVQFGVTADPE